MQDEDTKQQDTPSATGTGTGTSATLAAPPSESDLLERKRSLEIAADHLHVSTVEFGEGRKHNVSLLPLTNVQNQHQQHRTECAQEKRCVCFYQFFSFFPPSDSVGKEVKLYFREPSQLLSIFTDLEDENLKLIEQCQEAEDRLEEVRETTKKVMEVLELVGGVVVAAAVVQIFYRFFRFTL